MVITEYVDKELYEILDKEGKLSEERAQVIACDLVSALYYLHSNRVLHRFVFIYMELVCNICMSNNDININEFSEILNHKMYFWKQMVWPSCAILDLLVV